MKLGVPIVFVLCILTFVSGVSAQEKARTLVIKRDALAAKLVDEFAILVSEERSARFDAFFQEISQTPNSTGYVFLYCGQKCRYDEIVAHMRGIEVKIALRQFDRSRIVLRNAGFMEGGFRTQLWLVPEGAAVPEPVRGLNVNKVEFTSSGKRLMEAYDCCDSYLDVWKQLTKKP